MTRPGAGRPAGPGRAGPLRRAWRIATLAAPVLFAPVLFAPVLAASPTRAPDAAAITGGEAGARRLTELFAATCLAHAGDPAAIRALMEAEGYPRIAPEEESRLLNRPGTGYDASDEEGRFAVIAFNNGWCRAVAADVDRKALADAVEDALRAAGDEFHLVNDAPDARDPLRRQRRYAVIHDGRRIALLMVTAAATNRTQGSLFTAPLE